MEFKSTLEHLLSEFSTGPRILHTSEARRTLTRHFPHKSKEEHFGDTVVRVLCYKSEGRWFDPSRCERDFPPVQTGPGAHPASCTIGTGSFPEVKCGRGVLLTAHPILVWRSWKSRVIPLPTLWAIPGLQRDHFTFYSKICKVTTVHEDIREMKQ